MELAIHGGNAIVLATTKEITVKCVTPGGMETIVINTVNHQSLVTVMERATHPVTVSVMTVTQGPIVSLAMKGPVADTVHQMMTEAVIVILITTGLLPIHPMVHFAANIVRQALHVMEMDGVIQILEIVFVIQHLLDRIAISANLGMQDLTVTNVLFVKTMDLV